MMRSPNILPQMLLILLLSIAWTLPLHQTPFKFNVTCGSDIAIEKCKTATKILESIGTSISKSIILQKQVNVKVNFLRFNSSTPSSIQTQFIIARKNNGNIFQYPSALVRQAVDSEQLPLVDLHLNFNSRTDWYFEQLSKDPIGDRYDFERNYFLISKG